MGPARTGRGPEAVGRKPLAHGPYETVSGEFNQVARTFTKAASAIDPEMDPAEVTYAAERERRAWMQAPLAADKLTALISPLAAAAVLCGADAGLLHLRPESEPARLALVVDDKGLHRRAIWTAYEATDNRTGRWGPLVTLGAKIRPHPNPDQLVEYRRAKPMGVQYLPETAVSSRKYDPELDERMSNA